VPYDNPENYNHQAKRAAEKIPGAVWSNQFDNVANRYAHFHGTGPEIWNQTGGTINAFVMSTGTGGTLAGTSQYLKHKNKTIKCILADPPGSALYSYIKTGKLERAGSSITEGIGNGRVTENLKDAIPLIDDAVHIEDSRTIKMLYHLLYNEGIFVGASSALNVIAAVDVAKTLGSGKVIVTVLCDSAQRYASRLFSRKWLEEKKLIQYLENQHLKGLAV